MKNPKTVMVKELISSRYGSASSRPASWDARTSGADVVRLESGESVKLLSDGMQSPPQPGWKILLTSGDAANGYYWTLYGISKQN